MLKDWKSTASGILSLLVTILTTLSTFLVGGNLVAAAGTPGGPGVASIHVSTWITVGVNVLLAVLRGVIGLITTNADAAAVAAAIQPLVPATPTIASTPTTTTVTTPAIPTAASLAATPPKS